MESQIQTMPQFGYAPGSNGYINFRDHLAYDYDMNMKAIY